MFRCCLPARRAVRCGADRALNFAVEFATLTLDPVTKEPKAKIYKPSEIDAVLQKHGLAKKDGDTEMK